MKSFSSTKAPRIFQQQFPWAYGAKWRRCLIRRHFYVMCPLGYKQSRFYAYEEDNVNLWLRTSLSYRCFERQLSQNFLNKSVRPLKKLLSLCNGLKYIYHVTSLWITSCHKNRMTTRVITLWRKGVTSLTSFVSTMHFLIEIMLLLKAIKSFLKGHMINRILHEWSFHMKFMKLAEGSFNKFHMTWPLV